MKKLLLIAILGLSTVGMANNLENKSVVELERTLKENNEKIFDEVNEDEINHAVIAKLKDENKKIKEILAEKK